MRILKLGYARIGRWTIRYACLNRLHLSFDGSEVTISGPSCGLKLSELLKHVETRVWVVFSLGEEVPELIVVFVKLRRRVNFSHYCVVWVCVSRLQQDLLLDPVPHLFLQLPHPGGDLIHFIVDLKALLLQATVKELSCR